MLGRWLQLLGILETLIVLNVRVTLIVFSAFIYHSLRAICIRFTSREQHVGRTFMTVEPGGPSPPISALKGRSAGKGRNGRRR